MIETNNFAWMELLLLILLLLLYFIVITYSYVNNNNYCFLSCSGEIEIVKHKHKNQIFSSFKILSALTYYEVHLGISPTVISFYDLSDLDLAHSADLIFANIYSMICMIFTIGLRSSI